MSEIIGFLGTVTASPISFIISAVVFLAVFGAVFLTGLHVLSPRKTDRGGVPRSLRMRSSAGGADRSTGAALLDQLSTRPLVATQDEARQHPAGGAGLDPKRIFLAVHKILSALIMLILVTITIGAYFATQPSDGSRLAFWCLAVVTAVVGLHLHNVTRRHASADKDAALQADFRRSVQASLSDKIAAALLSQGKVQWEVASPEVHSIDRQTLDRARSMAAEGRSMDEICRAIEPGYNQWSPPHQQAFQNVVSAAIEHE